MPCMSSAVSKAHCYHYHGHETRCDGPGPVLMLCFGFGQLILSQLPSLQHMAWVSIVAAVMSGTYSSIAFGLAVAELVSTRQVKGGLLGVVAHAHLRPVDRAFKSLQALGNVAFAYTFAEILIEVQVCSNNFILVACTKKIDPEMMLAIYFCCIHLIDRLEALNRLSYFIKLKHDVHKGYSMMLHMEQHNCIFFMCYRTH